MKIGIISINMYSKGLNFACPLHNYAFQQFLLMNGIESTIIDYKPVYYNDFDLRHPYDYYAAMCNDFVSSGKNNTEVEEWRRITEFRDAWKELYAEREKRYDKFQNFIDSNYIKSRECYDSDLLEIKDPGFDCYICCTDVIWKKEPDIGFDRGFFLASKAMENKWKISYAASRGVFFSENEEDEKKFLDYVGDIDAISVREESLKQYLEKNIENKVSKVLDPVLLHDKEFYDNILIKPKEERYLFLYYVMEKAEDTIEQAVSYARAHGLKIVEITDKPLKNGRLVEYEDIERIYNYDMGIEEWLGYLRYAECVFTNSFHACCFSVLFEKQLYVGARNGDKVTHFLDLFGLSDRRINRNSDILTNQFPDIDYEKINPVLKEKQQESSDFILTAIHRMEHSQKEKKDYEDRRRSITYPICYSSGAYADIGKGTYDSSEGETVKLNTGSWGFFQKESIKNDGSSCLRKNRFSRKGYVPDGFHLCITIDRKCFWYLEDGSLVPTEEYNTKKSPLKRKFKEGEKIPYLPVNNVSLVEADALWVKKETEYVVIYGSGVKWREIRSNYDGSDGTLRISEDGTAKYVSKRQIQNNGKSVPAKNKFTHPSYDFVGWRIQVEDDRGWHWYLQDGTFRQQEKYSELLDGERFILNPDGKIPYLPFNELRTVVLEAVWTVKIMYYGGKGAGRGTYKDYKGKLRKRDDDSWEFFPKAFSIYDDCVRFRHNEFNRKGYMPDGWRLRIKTKDGWKWCLEDGTYAEAEEYKKGIHPPIRHFLECDVIPVLPKKVASYMVAEALWREEETKYKVIYCSGLKSKHLFCHYDGPAGCISKSEKGFAEYRPKGFIVNDGKAVLEKNVFEHPGYDFIGWRAKAGIRGKWYWYLENGTLRYEKEYNEKKDGKRCVLKDGEEMPYIPSGDVRDVVLEGLWQPKIKYCSGNCGDVKKGCYEEKDGNVRNVSDGVWEFTPRVTTMCDELPFFHKNKFSRRGYMPSGWKIRFRINKDWYWFLEDGSWIKVDEYDRETCCPVKIYSEYDQIPWAEAGKMSEIRAEAVWKKGAAEVRVIYNGARKADVLSYEYDESQGKVKVLDTGFPEYNPKGIIMNDGGSAAILNGFYYPGHKFLGWRMRIKENGRWYWYLADGNYKLQNEYSEKKDGKRFLLKDGTRIPYVPSSHVAVIVLDAVWRIELKAIAGKAAVKVIDKIRKIRG